ncbi:MAG: hypothetical protein M1831_000475 [Alyxoria varia]|nr:MAG: hypothetical protein M1831_000475 [Alyxoria varia]
MSASSLTERLDSLHNGLRETKKLILGLSELDSIKLSTKDPPQAERPTLDEARTELGAEIHANLSQYQDELELLNQDVEDLGPELVASGVKGLSSSSDHDIASSLYTGCRKLAEDLAQARVRYRKAQLQAKATSERIARDERAAYLESLQAFAVASSKDNGEQSNAAADESSSSQTTLRNTLFGGRRGPRKDPNATQEDLLLSASSDVTSSLKRTHALITSEVSRSQFAHETLETSNAALAELNERYESFDELLSKTKGVLGTLLRSQKSDTWYLETALRILVVTIAWLFFRRICYGLIWYFIWLPIKILYGALYYVFGGASLLFGPKASSKPLTTTSSLRIMPSATGKPAKIPEHVRAGQGGGYVRAGAGGAGAKAEQSSTQAVPKSPPGSYSESVGTMIEQSTDVATSAAIPQATQVTSSSSDPNSGPQDTSENRDQREGGEQHEDLNAGRRGDSQPLRHRNEAKEPPNPKKRMWEEPPPGKDQKNEEPHKEL